VTDRAAFAAWIDRYERSWRTAGTDHLRALFTEDASYRHSPYAPPVVGLAAIAADWERERTGPDEVFTMTAEIIAVEGDIGVAKLRVTYGDPVTQEYQDLWLTRFDADGRCSSFEEWPFWPDQPWTAD
jgi:ketosteroid isomerase-like protein